jgi:tetratricopeptide (TPR) repeat protein
LEEAEASYIQAIALKSDYADAHNNLGTTLKEMGRLEEAEASYRQVVALKPDFPEALKQLGIFLYINGNIDSGIESLEKAYAIESKDKDLEMLLAVLKSRKSSEKSRVRVGDLGNPVNLAESIPNRLILNRVVEADLIATLYEMSSRELDKTTDARFGNGVCSLNFNLFEDTRPIIKNVAEDLTRIITLAIKSEIYIYDSFFNILGAGGGSTPHRHLNKLDMVKELNIANKKYSLVYYLSEGDQNCSEPGILKLYDPGEDILPHQGMITIIPATRQHSAVYGGKKDRVMIGVNFYSL